MAHAATRHKKETMQRQMLRFRSNTIVGRSMSSVSWLPALRMPHTPHCRKYWAMQNYCSGTVEPEAVGTYAHTVPNRSLPFAWNDGTHCLE
jgi:hypothetical protein